MIWTSACLCCVLAVTAGPKVGVGVGLSRGWTVMPSPECCMN